MALSFRSHLARTLVLGLPLVGAQVAQILINTTDTVMLGWLGTEELAAGVLAFQLYFVLLIVGIGFAAAVVPIVATAIGEGDETRARRGARMGLWVLLGVSLLFMVPLHFTRDILVALGQDAELAAMAARYMVIAQWSLPFALLVQGLRSFLTALEDGVGVFLVTLTTLVVNALLDWALIFGKWGFPRLELEGAAWATLLSNAAAFALVVLYIRFKPEPARFAIFTRLWKPDTPMLRETLLLGWPIAFALLAEAGLFAISSLMLGWIGTVELAAHGIALQLASIAFMVPLGLSMAATVRVGNAYGRYDDVDLGRAGRAGFVWAGVSALVTASLFLVAPEPLIRLFLDDNRDAAAIIAVGVPLLAVAGLFQLTDALQVMGAGVLRGMKDTAVPMVIAVAAYWVLGVPTAYLLGFVLDYGPVGVWSGLVVGLTVAAIALYVRFRIKERLVERDTRHVLSKGAASSI